MTIARTLLLSLVLCSCNAESPEAPPEDAGPDSRIPAELPLPNLASCTPDYESIRENIIRPTCALPLCHLGGDSFMELVPYPPETTLINVPAHCEGWMRVVPGDPERSFLWHKLTEDDPACGDRMPWGYERLPEHALECIRTWIERLPH